jgi:hypothetical protein
LLDAAIALVPGDPQQSGDSRRLSAARLPIIQLDTGVR